MICQNASWKFVWILYCASSPQHPAGRPAFWRFITVIDGHCHLTVTSQYGPPFKEAINYLPDSFFFDVVILAQHLFLNMLWWRQQEGDCKKVPPSMTTIKCNLKMVLCVLLGRLCNVIANPLRGSSNATAVPGHYSTGRLWEVLMDNLGAVW